MAQNVSDDARIRQFWNAYARAARVSGEHFNVFAFGDSAELADELAAQVLAGTKRATSRLSRDFLEAGVAFPKPGDFGVLIDGAQTPRCILRTLQVELKPLRDVDARFAWDEGGGDRTLEWWMSAHTRYFKRQAVREGFAVTEQTEVVLERFEVVWPPDVADRATYLYGYT
jgi:uncharacterized protein YhfF